MQKNYNVGVIELISFSERIVLLIKHVVFEGSVMTDSFLNFSGKIQNNNYKYMFLMF